jgi:hypothetical protein
MKNDNLFAALRAAFPADLDGTAIETADGPGAPLCYRWRDLERGTAMLANLLQSLELPAGARIAVQTEKSVEALMLYLAVLRAGYVYLPLNTAYQAGEIEYFIGNAEPSVVVCAGRNFGWVSKIAFRCGTKNVFTLNDDRTGSLLDRAALMSDQHAVAQRGDDDLAAILYTSGTTGRSKGAMLTHANLLSNARVLNDYWGWRSDDVLIHALPIFQLYSSLNLFDTHIAVALAHCLFNIPLAVWILEGFMSGVPRELDETAFVDGYPFWKFFVKIFMPTIAAGIGVAAFFCFMFSWVELLLAKTLTSVEAKPIAATMTRTASTSGYELGLLAAAGALTIVPGAVVIYFVRNYIAKGFALGRV